jgi:hypothetical protein
MYPDRGKNGSLARCECDHITAVLQVDPWIQDANDPSKAGSFENLHPIVVERLKI